MEFNYRIMKKTFYSLIILFSLALLSSCSQSYLNEVEVDGVIYEYNRNLNESDVRELILSVKNSNYILLSISIENATSFIKDLQNFGIADVDRSNLFEHAYLESNLSTIIYLLRHPHVLEIVEDKTDFFLIE